MRGVTQDFAVYFGLQSHALQGITAHGPAHPSFQSQLDVVQGKWLAIYNELRYTFWDLVFVPDSITDGKVQAFKPFHAPPIPAPTDLVILNAPIDHNNTFDVVPPSASHCPAPTTGKLPKHSFAKPVTPTVSAAFARRAEVWGGASTNSASQNRFKGGGGGL